MFSRFNVFIPQQDTIDAMQYVSPSQSTQSVGNLYSANYAHTFDYS